MTAVLAPEMDLPKFHALLADKFHLGVGWVQEFFLLVVPNLINMTGTFENFDPRAELKYGLVGLHTCGDLGPTILHLFNQVEYDSNSTAEV